MPGLPSGAPRPFPSPPHGLPDPAHPFITGGHILASPQGCDLSLEDFNSQTPLHVAARQGHAGAVTLLLQRGSDVNARDQDGLSPLLLAVRGRYLGTLSGACGGCLWSHSSPGQGQLLSRTSPIPGLRPRG